MALVLIWISAAIAGLEENRPARVTGCGELCVRLLCEYYGVDFPQDKVLERLRPGQSGETSLPQLEDCLKSLGFECHALKGTPDRVAALDGPAILVMKKKPSYPYGHFSVVMVDKTTGQLMAYGPFFSPDPIQVSPEALEDHWTGVALIVGRPKGSGWWLWLLAVGACAGLLGALCGWLRPGAAGHAPSAAAFPERALADAASSPRIGNTAGRCAVGLLVPLLCALAPALYAGDASAVTPKEKPSSAVHDAGIFEKNEVDLGPLEARSGILVLTFRWRNTFDRTLNVTEIVKGCKCTSVVPSTKVIPAGSSVDFRTSVDLAGMEGNGGTAFLVKFDDDRVEPPYFSVLFRNTTGPHAEPAKIDFGNLVASAGTKRAFLVIGARDAEHGTLAVDRKIASTDPRVVCRVVEERETQFVAPNTLRRTVRYIAVVEAEAVATQGKTPLVGEIRVPVVHDGKKSAIVVPYFGTRSEPIIAHPSPLVIVVAKGAGSRNLSVRLARTVQMSSPISLTCKCSDPRLTVTAVAAQPIAGRDLVGELTVKVDLSRGESFESEVTVVVRAERTAYEIRIPVKVRVI